MIELDFEFVDAKYVTNVSLVPNGEKTAQLIDLIVDTGSSMTVMPKSLFDDLGYGWQNPRNVIIRGVNGESKGISTLIENFIIGGENIGTVRVVVSDLHPSIQDRMILGVNMLVWYNYAVVHHKRQIILEERRIKTKIPRKDRFIALYPQIINMLVSLNDEDNGMLSPLFGKNIQPQP
ncbi:MAG: retropepsin-like domain-containing protein [Defluviitaleaceae bacterium]|nr:retropepsin-like domain-containing protein [Defluviitaleaceae bacterium]